MRQKKEIGIRSPPKTEEIKENGEIKTKSRVGIQWNEGKKKKRKNSKLTKFKSF